LDPLPTPTSTYDDRIIRPAQAPTPARRPARRRTLGTCAHCHKPVAHDEEYVRLYRRAWHLDCALASEPRTD
jgi:hypothetical protein